MVRVARRRLGVQRPEYRKLSPNVWAGLQMTLRQALASFDQAMTDASQRIRVLDGDELDADRAEDRAE